MSEPAPESTLPYPPVHKDKKFVVLSDWLVPCYAMINHFDGTGWQGWHDYELRFQ